MSSLNGCPIKVTSLFYCDNNKLTSLQYCPNEIGGYLLCDNNPLVDISNINNTRIRRIFKIDYDKLYITIGNMIALQKVNKDHKVD